MKTLILLAIVGVLVAGVVVVLTSTLGPAKFDARSAGVTGPLAVGAVSRAEEPIQVWREPRGTISKEDREEMLVAVLRPGDRFKVLNHVPADVLWVEIQGLDDENLRGWIRSPPHEPVHASRVRD